MNGTESTGAPSVVEERRPASNDASSRVVRGYEGEEPCRRNIVDEAISSRVSGDPAETMEVLSVPDTERC